MQKYDRILITGGAGFVGSHLACAFRRDFEGTSVVVLDNLKRRGSELALPRLIRSGVEFLHGDIRNPEDIAKVGLFDLLIECAAEPSVHAGYNSSPVNLINTNLVGTTHCLEAAKLHRADVLFLSTSRVYPIARLRDLPLETVDQRVNIPVDRSGPGWSPTGISEKFPLEGARSLYGATKLASELLITEYSAAYGLRTIINRCGVLTGPWQMGKVDQGFVVLWAARHCYGGHLAYMGFSGLGHQVRDILHVADFYTLLCHQLERFDIANGRTFNVGGGLPMSVSLAELTTMCEKHSSNHLDIVSDPETRDVDVPWYIADTTQVVDCFDWRPTYGVEAILEEIFAWLTDHRAQLEPILET